MSNIIVNCQQIVRFPDTRKPLQAKQLIMELIPSFLHDLQYYCQLSANSQILRHLQSIAIQAAVCELVTVWSRDSNPRAYYF